MKKLLFVTLLALFASTVFGNTKDRSKVIVIDELPQTSQTIIKKYFGNSTTPLVRLWPNNYSAHLDGGYKLNFFLTGSLKQAQTDNHSLPKAILNELPKGVSTYVAKKYADWELYDLEVKDSKIELKLIKSGMTAKLDFDKTGVLYKEKIKN